MTVMARSDYEIAPQCRCAPSHSNFHGEKGCEHPVVRFHWNRQTQLYDIITLPCLCKVKGEIPE
jgi:hypothetical protein